MLSQWGGAAGKRVVITGATGGIGLAAARRLTALGARLTVLARSESKAKSVAGELGADFVLVDLSSKSSVRRAADSILNRYERVDVLVHNAGVYPTARILTDDWLELAWAVNHLAPYLLTKLLLPRMLDSSPARVVVTASDAHRRADVPFDDLDGARAFSAPSIRGAGYIRYAQTKLANVLFTTELARRLSGTGVTANCFHPGLVATGISRHQTGAARLTVKLMDRFSRRPEKGAATLVWLVDSPELDGVTGGYFYDERAVQPAATAQNPEIASRLWAISEQQTSCTFALAG